MTVQIPPARFRPRPTPPLRLASSKDATSILAIPSRLRRLSSAIAPIWGSRGGTTSFPSLMVIMQTTGWIDTCL